MIESEQGRYEGTIKRLAKVIKTSPIRRCFLYSASSDQSKRRGTPNRNNEGDNDHAHFQLRSDARRQFKDEYSKKLDLELDVSKGRLGVHGKGFYILVNGDVD